MTGKFLARRLRERVDWQRMFTYYRMLSKEFDDLMFRPMKGMLLEWELDDCLRGEFNAHLTYTGETTQGYDFLLNIPNHDTQKVELKTGNNILTSNTKHINTTTKFRLHNSQGNSSDTYKSMFDIEAGAVGRCIVPHFIICIDPRCAALIDAQTHLTKPDVVRPRKDGATVALPSQYLDWIVKPGDFDAVRIGNYTITDVDGATSPKEAIHCIHESLDRIVAIACEKAPAKPRRKEAKLW
jgi:hypothetical protein